MNVTKIITHFCFCISMVSMGMEKYNKPYSHNNNKSLVQLHSSSKPQADFEKKENERKQPELPTNNSGSPVSVHLPLRELIEHKEATVIPTLNNNSPSPSVQLAVSAQNVPLVPLNNAQLAQPKSRKKVVSIQEQFVVFTSLAFCFGIGWLAGSIKNG